MIPHWWGKAFPYCITDQYSISIMRNNTDSHGKVRQHQYPLRKAILQPQGKVKARRKRPLQDGRQWLLQSRNHLPLNVIFKLLDFELILFRLPSPGFLLLCCSRRNTLQQPFFPKDFGLWEGGKTTDKWHLLAHIILWTSRASASDLLLNSSGLTTAFTFPDMAIYFCQAKPGFLGCFFSTSFLFCFVLKFSCVFIENLPNTTWLP